MELRYFLNIVSRRIWIILFVPLVSALIMACISFFVLEPEYEACSTIYVTGKNYSSEVPIEFEDIMISQQLVKDYRELIKSRSITREVLERLKITDLSPKELANKITANLKNDTRILEIKVVDSEPARAKALADMISTVFVEKIKVLMKAENINIIDSAEMPEVPTKPRHFVNIAIAFIMGIFMSISIVLVHDYMDDTIKTEEDVEKYLGLTVLGTIPVSDI